MASVSQYIVVVSTIPTQLGRCNNVHCIVHSDIFYRATANGFNKPGSTETEHSLFTGCIKLLKVNHLLCYQYVEKILKSTSANGFFRFFLYSFTDNLQKKCLQFTYSIQSLLKDSDESSFHFMQRKHLYVTEYSALALLDNSALNQYHA